MIVFKQKEFLVGAAINGVLAGTSLLGLSQGADAQEEQERANKQAAKEMQRHNLAMEEAAKKNPVLANAVEENQQSFSISQKSYAVAPNPSMMTKATTFAKDMYGMYGGGMKKAAAMTAGFAGIGYAGNKIAQAVKRSDEGEGDKNKGTLAKAALGAAAIGSGILAARKGWIPGQFGKKAQTFMTTGAGGQALKSMNPIDRVSKEKAARLAEKAAKAGKTSTVKAGDFDLKGTLAKNSMNGLFLAMPTATYLMQRNAQKDQANNTQEEVPQQAQYSDDEKKGSSGLKKALIGGAAAVGTTVGGLALARRGALGKTAMNKVGGWYAKGGQKLQNMGLNKIGTSMTEAGLTAQQKSAKNGTLMNNITGGFDRAAQFMGFSGAKSGTKGVQIDATNMIRKGKQGAEHEWTGKVGEWMKDHKNLANIGHGVVLGGTGMAVMGLGNAVVEKPLKAIDKEAYAMDDQAEQRVASDVRTYSAKKILKLVKKSKKKAMEVANSAAERPGTFLGDTVNTVVKNTVDAPLSGTVAGGLLSSPIPGSTAASIGVSKVAIPKEKKIYEKLGIGKITKPIRKFVKKTSDKVTEKAGKLIDATYDLNQGGTVLLPGLNY